MAVLKELPSKKNIFVPCILNRASIGEADYVFVILQNIFGNKDKVAWVPRKDIVIEKQRFLDGNIKAKLKVYIKEETKDKYLVSILNRGMEETVYVAKQ